jgi:hypothetical protein
MEVQNGFIVGIFNYCDGWCKTCAFTSRCHVFADHAELEASFDPHLQAVVKAPPLLQDVPPPPPPWLQELIAAANEASETTSEDEIAAVREQRDRALEREPIYERSMAYAERVHLWRERHGGPAAHPPSDPRAVIEWFHTLIPAKIARALAGRALDDPAGRDWPADHDGSAKVALTGIERSMAAWEQLATRDIVPIDEVHHFIVDLLWQRDELERLFPGARTFVRPGFDEPEEVAKLLAAERQ